MSNRRILARALQELDKAQQAEEIAPAMERYFCEKSGLGPAEISDRRIVEVLEANGVARAGIETFLFIKGQARAGTLFAAQKVGAGTEKATCRRCGDCSGRSTGN